MNEVWSIDVAHMDKNAKDKYGVKYLLIAVDDCSRFLRVEPVEFKTADTTCAFKRMKTKISPDKVWSDKRKELKAEPKHFCDSWNVELYQTLSETMSVFAEQNIRSRKNIIYHYLEKIWSYHYINKFLDYKQYYFTGQLSF